VEIESSRQFFETLESRVDQGKAADLNASYVFEIDGSGTWAVDVDGGHVRVTEGGEADADCKIRANEETFMKIVRREQNPATAYMTGKLKISGDMGTAMKLQKLF
jgi:putative sterol carrier protein